MTDLTGHEAAIPNPALSAFEVLIGEWRTAGAHPQLPGTTLHGRAVFEWIHGGAFLRWRSEIDEPGIPSAIAVFGTDDDTGTCAMLYFDERGVSRRYEASIDGGVWRWWRDVEGFSQRYTGTISEDGRTIVGRGELSKDGRTWEPDLELTYTRLG